MTIGFEPTVLIVEDDYITGYSLAIALESEGFRIAGPAVDEEAAIRLISEEHPDLAVLDYHLGNATSLPIAMRLDQLGIPFLVSSNADRQILYRHAVFANRPFIDKIDHVKKFARELRQLIGSPASSSL